MVELSGDGGSTRRLPSWMLGSATQAMKSSDNRAENSCNLEEGLVSQACKSKAKRQKAKNAVAGKEKLILEVRSDVPSELVKKRRKRGLNQKEEHDGEDSISKSAFGEMKDGELEGRVRESLPGRKRKAKSDGCEMAYSLEVQPLTGYDEDFTVDDLLCIAQEHVKADEDMRLQRVANKGYEAVSESSSTIVSTANESGDYLIYPDKNPESSLRDGTQTSTFSSSSELTLTYSSSTAGGPTQDMLDLLLGPLLKKPEQVKQN